MKPNEDRDRALANEESWFLTGHILFEASAAISLWLEAGQFSDIVMVGEPIYRCQPDGFGFMWRRKLVAEMLYAFAVESWLKGILLFSLERSSEHEWKKLKALFEELSMDARSLDSQYIERIFQTSTLKQASTNWQESRSEEDMTRAKKMKAHGKHNLVRLAESARLSLNKEMKGYLSALSMIVKLGRYPALFDANVPNLEKKVGTLELRQQLNGLIHARYLELESRHPLLSESGSGAELGQDGIR